MYYLDLTQKTTKRYDAKKFMQYSGYIYDSMSSYLLKELKKLTPLGVYIVSGTEQRPDLISYTIYKDTQYWWLLMHYNSLLAIEDIIQGMQIKYFKLSDLEKIYFSLNSLAKVKS